MTGVSVIIPVYNNADFLIETLLSVVNQTHKNLEIIITDDASRDNSPAIVEKFSDPRIRRFYHKTNIGAEKNWNFGVTQSTMPYVKVIGADDTIDPTCIEKQAATLDGNIDIVLTICQRRIINSKSRVVIPFKKPRLEGRFDQANLARALVRGGTNILGEPITGLFKRDCFDKIGGYSGKIPYLIDADFWVRIAALGDVQVTPECLASFRISHSSWSSRIGRRQHQELMAFYDELAAHPEFKISRKTLGAGKIKAKFKAYIRQAYYSFFS